MALQHPQIGKNHLEKVGTSLQQSHSHTRTLKSGRLYNLCTNYVYGSNDNHEGALIRESAFVFLICMG